MSGEYWLDCLELGRITEATDLQCVASALGVREFRLATNEERKQSVWCFATLPDGKVVKIGRHRTLQDDQARWGSQDNPDIPLEVWAKASPPKVGWARDPNIDLDYMLFSYAYTRRFYLFPYRRMREVYLQNEEHWRKAGVGRVKPVDSNGGAWKNWTMFIPGQIVANAIDAV